MNEWLQQFANPNFMPHGHCYLWRPDILWTHVISDAVIGIAYYVIPIVFGLLIMKRKGVLPHKDLFALFTAFIFFCGTTHFVQIYITWYPMYEYQGWLKVLTAFTSILTALVLAPKLPQLLKFSTLEDDYRNNLKELETLRIKNEQMNAVYSATIRREQKVIELQKEINDLMTEMGREKPYDV